MIILFMPVGVLSVIKAADQWRVRGIEVTASSGASGRLAIPTGCIQTVEANSSLSYSIGLPEFVVADPM